MTKTQREHFENFVDFLEIGKLPKSGRRHSANQQYDSSAAEDSEYSRKWCGLPDGWSAKPEQLAARLALGYEEGAHRVAKMRDTISVPQMVNIRRRSTWGEQGESIDMDRVRAGQLDRAWRGPRKVVCQPPRVLILADVCANAGEDADSMAWRGVASLVLADALNEAGYQIAIVNGFKTMREKSICVTSVVKHFRSPLSILDLSSAIVLPATFRSLGINALWYLANFDLGSGCGMASVLKADDAPDMGQNITIVLDASITNEKSARDWVVQRIGEIEGRYRRAA